MQHTDTSSREERNDRDQQKDKEHTINWTRHVGVNTMAPHIDTYVVLYLKKKCDEFSANATLANKEVNNL